MALVPLFVIWLEASRRNIPDGANKEQDEIQKQNEPKFGKSKVQGCHAYSHFLQPHLLRKTLQQRRSSTTYTAKFNTFILCD